MSSRREISEVFPRTIANLTRREEIILRNHDRARRRLQARARSGRDSVETGNRARTANNRDVRFGRNRSHHERPRVAPSRRPEQVSRRLEARYEENSQSPEPVVSHRIVGRDVDVNEDLMFDRLPAPDRELHMQFARIIMISLPVSSVSDMRRRGMMEDIQRVTGLGIENDLHEEYDDDGYDQSDLEDEFGYNTELDDVVVLSTVNRYPNGKVSVAPEISSDEPMDDYQSSDANNDSHRGRLMPKSANRQGPNARRKSLHASGSPLESLRQSDEYEEELSAESSGPPMLPSISVVPPTSLSRPNSRPFNDISTDQAEVDRFRECLTGAQISLVGRRASIRDEVLDKHMKKAPQLVKQFKYEAMLKSVLQILENGNCGVPPVRNQQPQLEADIPSEIYRVVEQSQFKVENTAQSRLREAYNLLDLNQVFEAEIQRRNLDPSAYNNRDNPVIASIKLDMACASTGRSRQDLMEMQAANSQPYRNCMAPVHLMRGHGLRVFTYTNTMGNELQQLIEMFAEIPRADNVTYSEVGIMGHDMSLNVTDVVSLGSQMQLTERAIEAVLATTKFPEGVMFARASGYESLYDQQEYEHERSMSIRQGLKTILCPVHTGESTQHWVGVVVQLDFMKRGRLGISMILLDSMATDSNSAIYHEQVIKKIVKTWLRHRLPDYGSFAINGELARPRVEQQVDLNSRGVHMLLNLRAAGLDGKYISKGSNCTSKEWIDDARKNFVKRILRSAGKHLGGDVESTINELLDESSGESREVGTNKVSAGRGLSPRLGS
ncbi:hypothetical protein V501_05114 [Pseudogymnoascus sp. VKM F-4519 (FW-2642)]|nr:hypothetical protein V501_05114 [Pseudogymnoascus sp. VKM F-4519 (FW-2642)]